MRWLLPLAFIVAACGSDGSPGQGDDGEPGEEDLIYEVLSTQCSSAYYRADDSIRYVDTSCGADISNRGTLTALGRQTLDQHIELMSGLADDDWESCAPVDGTDVVWHFDDGTTLVHCASPAPMELSEAVAFMDALAGALVTCTDSEHLSVAASCAPAA